MRNDRRPAGWEIHAIQAARADRDRRRRNAIRGLLQASAGTKAVGIDVSRFQGVIDWNAVAGSEFGSPSSRRAGAWLDCTVRPDQCGADPYFATNRLSAKDNRLGPTTAPRRRRDDRPARTMLAEADLFIAQGLPRW